MKNVIIFSVILFFFVIVPHVSAEGFTALAPIPGLTDSATVNTASGLAENTLANFFNNLYKYLVGLAAVIAVIEIIFGGIEISTPDSVAKEKLGKERIYNAIFGLVLVLSPVLVFSVINPSILNLSLNLPKLDTRVSTTTPVRQQLPPCIAGNTAGAGVTCTFVPLDRSGTTATLPTCGPSVVGTCTTVPPACLPGKYCYRTIDRNNIAAVECSSSSAECTLLFTEQSRGGYGGVTATESCRLCPNP